VERDKYCSNIRDEGEGHHILVLFLYSKFCYEGFSLTHRLLLFKNTERNFELSCSD
jgi:hypothetical protein